MDRYHKDSYFASSLESLVKVKDKKEFVIKARKLEDYIFQKNNPLLAFRLALELDLRGFKTSRLENYIISCNDPRYILKFAREIRRANIKKLQDAIIRRGSILQIAKFGCFIRGAQRSVIEDLIVKSEHAKSAYFYLKYVKFCNVNKLKPIILKSKKPRYLFALAKVVKSKKELDLIQDLIIESTSNTYVRLFAVHIKGADIKRLEDRIIETKNVMEMKKFARAVNSPRLNKLALLF
jgi:hypothetical protein